MNRQDLDVAAESDAALYRKHAAELTRYATMLVGPDDAADVVATAVMAWFGYRTTQFFANLGQLSTTEIEFPLWYLYVSYPVGMLLAASFCLESLLGELAGRRRRLESEVL